MLTHGLKIECYKCGTVFYDETLFVEDVVRTEMRIKPHTCPSPKSKAVNRLKKWAGRLKKKLRAERQSGEPGW